MELGHFRVVGPPTTSLSLRGKCSILLTSQGGIRQAMVDYADPDPPDPGSAQGIAEG